jgi:hypothetical protein
MHNEPCVPILHDGLDAVDRCERIQGPSWAQRRTPLLQRPSVPRPRTSTLSTSST